MGLELPLTRYPRLQSAHTFGVLSGPSNWLGQMWGLLVGRAEHALGYAVEGAMAVEILEASSPDAARWWREHAPQHLGPQRYLLFHEHVCEPVTKPA